MQGRPSACNQRTKAAALGLDLDRELNQHAINVPKRRHSASIWIASSRVGAMMSVVSTGKTRPAASRTIEANAGSR